MFASSPVAMARSVTAHRHLLWQLTKRDVSSRYRGSVFGLLWSVAQPLLLLGVYTFVFKIVFKARWGAEAAQNSNFALILFAGLITFGIFADTISRAPTLIVAHPNYVKRMVFPLELLPWMALGSSMFQAIVSYAILLIAIPVFAGTIPWTAVLLPVVLLPLVLATIGISWLLASLGVYLRDITQIITLFVTVLLFTTPIFYPLDAVPESLQTLIRLSPVTIVVQNVRDVMLWGNIPDWRWWLGSTVLGLVLCWLGFVWFQQSRKGFADVV